MSTQSAAPSSSTVHSVGIVEPQTFYCDAPITLASGDTLPAYQLVYETYGTLNADNSNAVLICHALTGDHHAAGRHHPDDKKPGWWDTAIGPGKAIDTDHLFVVALNNLGGCRGSTGPTSINPDTEKPYGPDFPVVTVNDWVQTQAVLADYLQIERWLAVIGGSLGGMQALQWSISFPERLQHCIVIASAPKLSTQNIAFNEVARQAILSDPDYREGYYADHELVPATGLKLARMLGHITYLSDAGMKVKFGRELKDEDLHYNYETDFQIESYLRYQGEQFVGRFDANTYLIMGKALDYYDPAAAFNDKLSTCFAQTDAKFLVISFTSDWRFSPERSQEIVSALVKAGKSVSYANIETDYGHDAFLMDVPEYLSTFRAYCQQMWQSVEADSHRDQGETA